jgi:triacylglycerol lipase
MRAEHASAIAAMGAAITPELVDGTQRLYAPHHAGDATGLNVTRDRVYGPDERNRLDVFTTDASGARPVLVYVHGGGFVRGDKSLPGTPYYDNVGRWAAANDFVGVTMTYRFAPAHTYPACAIDIANAVRWLRANVARFGGDPDAIVLVGQSAGAAHTATYVARRDLWPDGAIGVAGVALFSGIYDFTTFEHSPGSLAYVGQGAEASRTATSLPGLVAAGVPIFFVVAEFDPPAFHAQGMQLADALFARDGRFPNVLYLPGHNHISQVVHLGAEGVDDPLLAARLGAFIRAVSPLRQGLQYPLR